MVDAPNEVSHGQVTGPSPKPGHTSLGCHHEHSGNPSISPASRTSTPADARKCLYVRYDSIVVVIPRQWVRASSLDSWVLHRPGLAVHMCPPHRSFSSPTVHGQAIIPQTSESDKQHQRTNPLPHSYLTEQNQPSQISTEGCHACARFVHEPVRHRATKGQELQGQREGHQRPSTRNFLPHAFPEASLAGTNAPRSCAADQAAPPTAALAKVGCPDEQAMRL